MGVYDSYSDSDIAHTGLFSLRQRNLGQAEFRTTIEGEIQNVDGVDWVTVEYLGYRLDESPPILKVRSDFQDEEDQTFISCDTDQCLRLCKENLSIQKRTEEE